MSDLKTNTLNWQIRKKAVEEYTCIVEEFFDKHRYMFSDNCEVTDLLPNYLLIVPMLNERDILTGIFRMADLKMDTTTHDDTADILIAYLNNCLRRLSSEQIQEQHRLSGFSNAYIEITSYHLTKYIVLNMLMTTVGVCVERALVCREFCNPGCVSASTKDAIKYIGGLKHAHFHYLTHLVDDVIKENTPAFVGIQDVDNEFTIPI